MNIKENNTPQETKNGGKTQQTSKTNTKQKNAHNRNKHKQQTRPKQTNQQTIIIITKAKNSKQQ